MSISNHRIVVCAFWLLEVLIYSFCWVSLENYFGVSVVRCIWSNFSRLLRKYLQLSHFFLLFCFGFSLFSSGVSWVYGYQKKIREKKPKIPKPPQKRKQRIKKQKILDAQKKRMIFSMTNPSLLPLILLFHEFSNEGSC